MGFIIIFNNKQLCTGKATQQNIKFEKKIILPFNIKSVNSFIHNLWNQFYRYFGIFVLQFYWCQLRNIIFHNIDFIEQFVGYQKYVSYCNSVNMYISAPSSCTCSPSLMKRWDTYYVHKYTLLYVLPTPWNPYYSCLSSRIPNNYSLFICFAQFSAWWL